MELNIIYRLIAITVTVATQNSWFCTGMDGVDKEKVQKIVYEMSKGSKFFVNEQRKDAYIKQKIESLRVQCAKLTENDIFHFQKVSF